VFMSEMVLAVDSGNATDAMKNELDKVLKWLEVESTDQLTVAHQEKFAKGFEQYLMEGKAPSPELIPAFKRFSRWLKEVYKNVTSLGVNLTPEIREVFDGMINAEQQIDEAIDTAGLTQMTQKEMDDLGILPEDQEYLNRLYEDAVSEAEQKLHTAAVKGVKDAKAKWREEAEKLADQNTMHDIANKFKKGQGINKQLAIEIWGQAVIDQMPPGLKTVFKKDGMNPDEAAYESGFKSAEELLDALQAYIPRNQEIKNYIEQRTQEFVAALDPVDFIFDTKSFADYIGVLGNYTAGKMDQNAQLDERLKGKKGSRKVMARSAFKKYAKNLIRSMPDRFIAAVKKAANAEKAAIKKQDWTAAQRANEQMRLNFEMAQESRKIRQEVEKFDRRAKRLKKAAGKKPLKINAPHLGAALKLMTRFGIVELNASYAPVLEKAGDINKLITDNFDAMAPSDFGFDPFLTEGSESMSYKDLPVDTLNELHNLIKILEVKGRDALDPRLTSLDKRLDEVLVELTSAVSTLMDKPKWAKRGKSFFGMDPVAGLRRMQDAAREHYADTNQLWAMIRVLDGFVYYTDTGEQGPFERYFRDNLDKAYATRTLAQKKYRKKLEGIFSRMMDRGRELPTWLDSQISVPVPATLANDGRGWDFDAVLSVAMNVGNESNMLRLKEGFGWTDEQVQNIVSVLEDSEWDAIQEAWDVFEEMRPEFFAASERINGIAPPHIEPRSFNTPSGKSMRGGYAPAVYDLSNVRAGEIDENQLIKETSNSAHQRPSVNATATKTRAATGGGRPIRLDLSGVSRQYEYNLQYTAFAETIRDLARVLNDQALVDTIAQKVGPEWVPTMREVLSHIANPGRDARANFATRVLKGLGTSASKYILGLKRSVGIKQVFSVPAVYQENGSWHRGVLTVLRNPNKAWDNMMEESPAMLQRFGDVSIDREIAKQRNQLHSRSAFKGVPAEAIDAILFMYIRAFDAMAVLPAYYGTKQLMDKKYGPGARSLRETEKVILDTQPISREMDLSTMQLNRTAMSRMFTFFTGFTQKFENRKRVYVRGFREGKIPFKKFATHVVLERLLPPLFMNLLFTAGAGDDLEGDDMLWDLLLYQVCGFPVVRELSVLGANAIRKATDPEFKGFSAFGTPLAEIPKAIEWNMNKLAKWFAGEADDKEAVLAAVDLILATRGVPAVKAYKDFEEGFRQFENSEGFDAWFKLLIKPDFKEAD